LSKQFQKIVKKLSKVVKQLAKSCQQNVMGVGSTKLLQGLQQTTLLSAAGEKLKILQVEDETCGRRRIRRRRRRMVATRPGAD
jgi:hypothetical protein